MIFKSKYTIRFSKQKESVLNYISENLCKNLLDFNKKYFGITSKNGFEIKFYGSKNSATIIGKFIIQQNEERLLLTISYLYLDIIACFLLVAGLPLYFLYKTEYSIMFIFTGVGIVFTVIKYSILKESKKQFLKNLRNFDKLCEITELKN